LKRHLQLRCVPAEETDLPGYSVLARDEADAIFHTYSTVARGIDALSPVYQALDLVPKGRDEAGLEHTMSWVKASRQVLITFRTADRSPLRSMAQRAWLEQDLTGKFVVSTLAACGGDGSKGFPWVVPDAGKAVSPFSHSPLY